MHLRTTWSTIRVLIWTGAALFPLLSTATLFAQPATASATQPDGDPRLGLAAFYDAVRAGDEAKAFACWYDDVQSDDRRTEVEELVRHLVKEMIASARFEDALRQKFPADYDKARREGHMTPEAPLLTSCRYAVYRRLAICSWGQDEDDGFPLVLDNSGIFEKRPAVWKLSMQQWHETNQSSVGDSMLLSGLGARAKDLTTKDVLAGKFKNADEIELGFLQHMHELEEADEKASSAATKPVN